jgi:integrase
VRQVDEWGVIRMPIEYRNGARLLRFVRDKRPSKCYRFVARMLSIAYPRHDDLSLATGLRKSNVAGLEWERIDLARRCCFVPGYLTKRGDPIPVLLNDDAIEVLTRWQEIHEDNQGKWSAAMRRYVFVYRRRAPIQQLTTRMWRRECKAVGLEGVTFHTMRHAWAALEMPLRYAYLDPGHLAEYADHTLIGGDFRAETGKPYDVDLDSTTQPIDLNGKGGTRTLDPGIMSAVL